MTNFNSALLLVFSVFHSFLTVTPFGTHFGTVPRPIRDNKVSAFVASSTHLTSISKSVTYRDNERLVGESLRSNSTASSLLLRDLDDWKENGSDNNSDVLMDELLTIVDGYAIDSDGLNDINGLQPRWTRISVLGTFSRRARRATLLRRVLRKGKEKKRKDALYRLLETQSKLITSNDGNNPISIEIEDDSVVQSEPPAQGDKPKIDKSEFQASQIALQNELERKEKYLSELAKKKKEEDAKVVVSNPKTSLFDTFNNALRPNSDKALAAYYGDMDPSDRAFTILHDLGMIEITPDPSSSDYDGSLDSKLAPENVYVEEKRSVVKIDRR